MRKDGPNKGREFYKCAKQPPCDNFFAWADTGGQNTSYRGGGGGASTSGSNFQNQSRNNGNNAGNAGQGVFSYIEFFHL